MPGRSAPATAYHGVTLYQPHPDDPLHPWRGLNLYLANDVSGADDSVCVVPLELVWFRLAGAVIPGSLLKRCEPYLKGVDMTGVALTSEGLLQCKLAQFVVLLPVLLHVMHNSVACSGSCSPEQYDNPALLRSALGELGRLLLSTAESGVFKSVTGVTEAVAPSSIVSSSHLQCHVDKTTLISRECERWIPRRPHQRHQAACQLNVIQ